MSHLDDEALAELALGGGQPSDAEHTAACADCRAELESLRATLARVQAAGPGTGLLTPPDRVWEAVVADLEDADSAAPASAESPSTADGGTDDLASRRERRGSRWPLAAAAAAGVVVGGVGVGVVLGVDTGGDEASVVAQAPLTDLASETPAGDAVLETRADGTQVLVVDTEARDVEGAYLEVWLIDEDIDGMVSLGHLSDGTGEFVIPEGFDVGAFPIVDISVEPLDGVPTHSGDSVTRGVFDA
ncbi:anti-sigma factor [Demequina sp. SO4-18]|uniref:anti-sigma factor n=1 Tax=Demequina sp. SO4-18 TaxID=3401026 RepID=UPI003B59E3CD